MLPGIKWAVVVCFVWRNSGHHGGLLQRLPLDPSLYRMIHRKYIPGARLPLDPSLYRMIHRKYIPGACFCKGFETKQEYAICEGTGTYFQEENAFILPKLLKRLDLICWEYYMLISMLAPASSCVCARMYAKHHKLSRSSSGSRTSNATNGGNEKKRMRRDCGPPLVNLTSS